MTELQRNQIIFALTWGLTTIVAIIAAWFLFYHDSKSIGLVATMIFFGTFIIESYIEREILQNKIRVLESKPKIDELSFLFKILMLLDIVFIVMVYYAKAPDKEASLTMLFAGLFIIPMMYFLKWRPYCRHNL